MWNITHVFPEAVPLTYRKLGNLLASLGRDYSTYDEAECFKLVFLQLNSFWSVEAAQFLLSSPLVTHEIENIESLPFSAEVKNIFGEDLRLTLEPLALNGILRSSTEDNFDEALLDYGTSVDKLLPLFQIAFQKLNNPSKTTVSRVVFNILVPISDFFDLKCEPERKLPIAGSPLFSVDNPTYGPIVPDYCIRDESQNVVCVVNIKPPSFFSKIPEDIDIRKTLCYGNMAEIMKELQVCMIAACSKFGILCDGYNLILVEFTEKWFYYQKNYLQFLPSGEAIISLQHDQSLSIPYLVVLANVHSTDPSFLEGLTGFLYRAKTFNNINQWSPLYKYLHLALQPRNKLNTEFGSTTEITDSTKVPIFGSEATVETDILYKSLMQGIEDKCMDRSKYSVSFKVPARVLRDVLTNEFDDDEFVVMKIYEPEAFRDKKLPPHDVYYEENNCAELYFKEWQAVLLLRDTPNFNNIYWMHPMVQIQYFPTCQKPITGCAIISKYFESEPIPQNLETYELAKRQLEMIHEAGGAYTDFEHVNMAFSAGKLYLYGVFGFWDYDDYPKKHKCLTDRSFHHLAGHFEEALKKFGILLEAAPPAVCQDLKTCTCAQSSDTESQQFA